MLKNELITMISMCSVLFFATPVWASTINAASCSYADVSAGLTAASPGDTVAIPAGTCTWSASEHLNITKQISIIGAGTTSGANLTKIIHNVLDDDSSATPATFNINVTSDVPVRISGIYFDKASNISGPTYPYYYREAIHISGSENDSFALTKIRIDHNFFNMGSYTIFSRGWVYGLVDSNTFLNPNTAIFIGGDNSYAWDRPIAAGTANAFFIEGNTFILDTNFGTGSTNEMIYPQEGARVVARYNTYDASLFTRSDTPQFCTSHPNWGGSAPYYEAYRGQPIYEVYNNAISLLSSYAVMTAFRGGSVIIHDNTIRSNPGNQEHITRFTEEEGWTIGGPWCYSYWTPNTDYSLGDKRQPAHYNGFYYQVTADNGLSGTAEPNWPTTLNGEVNDGGLVWTNMGAAPCPRITTWPANDQIMNSFIWNNYINGSLNDNVDLDQTTSNGYGYDDVLIHKDRDYFLHSPEADGGSTYYASNSQCTASAISAACCTGIGVGHCSAGHFDAVVYSPSGPNAYYPYSPYTCPHPLTGLTGTCDPNVAGISGYSIPRGDTTPPAAPSALTVR
jgi:hypothetical protein